MKKLLYYTIYIVGYALSLLPFWVLYGISDVFYAIVYKALGYRTKVVRSNLSSSFPEKDASELKDIEKRFYHCLCDYIVETIKMMSMSKAKIRRHMVFHGVEEIDRCVEEGQSVAVYLGHLFNWEWITSLPLWTNGKGHCGQLYHSLENESFDIFFLKLRQRWGAECIALTDILRKTVEYKQKQQPTVIGYIGDQVPHWNNIHHWCQFLNHDTPVMTGAERIAKKNDQALFYMDIERVKRGYYKVTMQPITRRPKELKEYESVDIYFQLLEQNIRRQPELWLWSHNRWKRTREEFNERFEVINGKVVPKEGME